MSHLTIPLIAKFGCIGVTLLLTVATIILALIPIYLPTRTVTLNSSIKYFFVVYLLKISLYF